MSHVKTEKPCQDAHHSLLLPDGTLIAAVADGAGSAARAETGAGLAALAAVETLAKEWERSPCLPAEAACKGLLLEAAAHTRRLLEAAAEKANAELRDFATTLILAVATPERVAVLQIGDGACVAQDASGELTALTVPPDNEYANETIFLTSPNALDTAQMADWHGQARFLALFSDGLQRLALKLPSGSPHAPFFAPLFQFVGSVEDAVQGKTQLEAFLRSPRITERADDDLTLLLAALKS